MTRLWHPANRFGPPPGEPFSVVVEEKHIRRSVWEYLPADPRATPERVAQLLGDGRVVRDGRGDLRVARPDGRPHFGLPPVAVLVDSYEEDVRDGDDLPGDDELD